MPSCQLVGRVLASWIFFALMWLSWIIFLAGTAATHKSCVDIKDTGKRGTTIDLFGRKLLTSAEDSCANQMSLPWWVVWFQCVCIVFAMLVASIRFMSSVANTSVAFFVSCTTIMMYNASVANVKIFENKDSEVSDVKDLVSGLRCALAGMVMSMLLNFIYIICNTEESCSLVFHLGCGSPRSPNTFQTNTELPKACVQETPAAPPATELVVAKMPSSPATPAYSIPANTTPGSYNSPAAPTPGSYPAGMPAGAYATSAGAAPGANPVPTYAYNV